jgi:uncharacterized protein HemX
MFNAKRFKNAMLTAAIGGSLILAVGCTKHPNEGQIRVMEETRQAALAAEQKLQEMQTKERETQNRLSQAEAELQDCNEKSAATAERLKQFTE